MDITTASTSQLVERFVEVRDALAATKKEFEARQDAAKAIQAAIQAQLLSRFNEEEIESMSTAIGTAYIHSSKKPRCEDWNALWDCVYASKDFDLLQKRLGARAIEAYVEMHGAPPPGVKVETFREIRIRKT